MGEGPTPQYRHFKLHFRIQKVECGGLGNLFLRKRRVLASLCGAQKAIANYPSDFLFKLEKQLTKKYSTIKLQEEEYWALKLGCF